MKIFFQSHKTTLPSQASFLLWLSKSGQKKQLGWLKWVCRCCAVGSMLKLKTEKKSHSYCWHASSPDNKPSQIKKPRRVPPEMFYSQESPSLVPLQGHHVWMLSPSLREKQSNRRVPVASSEPFTECICYVFTAGLQYKHNMVNWNKIKDEGVFIVLVMLVFSHTHVCQLVVYIYTHIKMFVIC